MYFSPRDCPRTLFWPLPSTTAEDRERHWGEREARIVACAEWAWRDRIASARLFRYALSAGTFEDLDDAGMHVSRATVRPLAVDPMGDLFAAHEAAGIELRLMPTQLPLRRMWATTLHASGIRLRHAAGWVGARRARRRPGSGRSATRARRGGPRGVRDGARRALGGAVCATLRTRP